MIEKLLRGFEVAERLSISRGLAYKLMAQGDIPTVRFSGKSVRVRPEDLEDFIKKNLNTNDSSNAIFSNSYKESVK